MNLATKNPILEGSILKSLFKLALPIMGTSFIQIAYNMTDMMWLGHYGLRKGLETAAVGVAGFYLWFGMAFILISKVGTEIGVAQSVGAGKMDRARSFFRNAVFLNIALALAYACVLMVFDNQLIGFLNVKEPHVRQLSMDYLKIAVFGIPFMFINPVITALYNGYGNTKVPFYANTVGLFCNIVLDPVLIYGIGGFPEMGVKGAAIATVLSQVVVTAILLVRIIGFKEPIGKVHIFTRPDRTILKQILVYGFPVAFHNGMFTIFAMLITRQVALWGETAISVQTVGAQIESISWMTAGGFSTALSTFVGQNYAAGHKRRVIRGYIVAMAAISVVGICATLFLVFAGASIFACFIPNAKAISYGAVYLKILGYSQLFMCFEITTAGAFNGLGKTLQPSIVSFLLTGARVPGAIWLSKTALKLEGIWWSISLSSILKGLILISLFSIQIKKLLEPEVEAIAIRCET